MDGPRRGCPVTLYGTERVAYIADLRVTWQSIRATIRPSRNRAFSKDDHDDA
jgi:hypothetical protein